MLTTAHFAAFQWAANRGHVIDVTSDSQRRDRLTGSQPETQFIFISHELLFTINIGLTVNRKNAVTTLSTQCISTLFHSFLCLACQFVWRKRRRTQNPYNIFEQTIAQFVCLFVWLLAYARGIEHVVIAWICLLHRNIWIERHGKYERNGGWRRRLV